MVISKGYEHLTFGVFIFQIFSIPSKPQKNDIDLNSLKNKTKNNRSLFGERERERERERGRERERERESKLTVIETVFGLKRNKEKRS